MNNNKFRFTAMNKMPWDDANDQFVIQVKNNHLYYCIVTDRA